MVRAQGWEAGVCQGETETLQGGQDLKEQDRPTHRCRCRLSQSTRPSCKSLYLLAAI